MTQETIEKIQEHPKYQKLLKERTRLAWILSIIMLVIYYTFIMIIAFEPDIFGMKLGESVITLGIPVGIFIIVIAFILTGVYVYQANQDFDELSDQVKKDVGVDS